MPSLSVQKQFELLQTELRDSTSRGPLGEMVIKYLGGEVNRVGQLFTISKEQYLQWARTLPLSSFVATEPSTFDGDYLFQKDDGWLFQQQERGAVCWEKSFKSQEEAFEFVLQNCSPYGIYKRLML